ncbi:MAG: hypothetical protein LBE25_10630 [Arthrobacter sp.]|jgi:hypothetical protein|nr:hypothetical protein [Arthrobacter sp.]
MDLQGLVARLAMERESVRRALGGGAELRPAGWSGTAAGAYARQLEAAREAGSVALGSLDVALHAAQRALTCSLATAQAAQAAAPGAGSGSASRWG